MAKAYRRMSKVGRKKDPAVAREAKREGESYAHEAAEKRRGDKDD
jgi:hypothetical protein